MTPIRPGARLTTAFGHDIDPVDGGYRFHRAIDRAGGDGLIYCPMTAKKAFIEYQSSPSYGTLIRLIYDGFEIRLAHARDFKSNFKDLVTRGQEIPEGMVLAHEGSIGKSTGEHTHIEVVSSGGYAPWIIERLNAAAIPMKVAYLKEDLMQRPDYSELRKWLTKFMCTSIGPTECIAPDWRTDKIGFWIDPLALGL